MADGGPKQYFEAPEQLTRTDRARDTLITAILWAAYLYLWVPLVSLLAWALGFEFAYDVMVRAGGAQDLLPILLEYAVVVSIIFSAFTLWSVSNRLRFRNRNRRELRTPVNDDALAKYFDISSSQIAALRSRQVMTVSVDESGRPSLFEISDAAFEDEPWPLDDEDDETMLQGASIAS